MPSKGGMWNMGMDNDRASALTTVLNKGIERSIAFETELKKLLDNYTGNNKESLEQLKVIVAELMLYLTSNSADLQTSNMIGAVTILQKLVDSGYLDHQAMLGLPIFKQFKQTYCPNSIIRQVPRQPMQTPAKDGSQR